MSDTSYRTGVPARVGDLVSTEGTDGRVYYHFVTKIVDGRHVMTSATHYGGEQECLTDCLKLVRRGNVQPN